MNMNSGNQRKEKLIKEIEKVKRNIDAYRKLQKQIQMIDRELSVAENGVTKSQSSFESPQKKRCSNSHKKIKVYELQKKANTKQKEHKEKHQVCLKKLEKEEEILKMIEERKKTIEKEMENKKLLEETECHLDKQIYHVEYRKSEIQKLFSEERGVVQKYEIEKKGRYENIRRMKKQLKIECDKTEADDSLMNISEDYSDEEYSITSDNFEEVQRNEIRRVQLMRKEVQGKNLPFNILTNKLREEIDERVYELEKVKEKNMDLIKLIHKLKIQNRSKQGLVKHSKTTIELNINKMEALCRGVQNQNNTNYERQEKMKNYEDKLSSLEGERGRLRGKLGIRVENVRLLGLVNEELKTELEQLLMLMQGMRMTRERARKLLQKDDILLQSI